MRSSNELCDNISLTYSTKTKEISCISSLHSSISLHETQLSPKKADFRISNDGDFILPPDIVIVKNEEEIMKCSLDDDVSVSGEEINDLIQNFDRCDHDIHDRKGSRRNFDSRRLILQASTKNLFPSINISRPPLISNDINVYNKNNFDRSAKSEQAKAKFLHHNNPGTFLLLGHRPRRKQTVVKCSSVSVGSLVGQSSLVTQKTISSTDSCCIDDSDSFNYNETTRQHREERDTCKLTNIVHSEAKYVWRAMKTPIKKKLMREDEVILQRSPGGYFA